MMESQLLQKYFVGKDGFYWWIGQIVGRDFWQGNITANPTPTNASQPGFGERYKVRILGYHPQDQNELDDQKLPWAHVMYPVTGGGGNQASWQSANLRQGRGPATIVSGGSQAAPRTVHFLWAKRSNYLP